VQTCIVHLIRQSLRYVPRRQYDQVVKDLRPIYTAVNADAAMAALEAFEERWGAQLPVIGQAWRNSWEYVIPFLAFEPEVRRVIYTTNAIEALNRQLRKAIKTKGHFPNEEAARKLIYLAISNATPAWTRTRSSTAALLAFKSSSETDSPTKPAYTQNRMPSSDRLSLCGPRRARDRRACAGRASEVRQDEGWTTINEFPSGSRTQNIGGTGPPQRVTSSSTSTPEAFRAAWSASTSEVSRQIPVWLAPASWPGGGGASAIVVGVPRRATSTQRPASPIGTSTTFSKPSVST
jgi:hypothetical protein